MSRIGNGSVALTLVCALGASDCSSMRGRFLIGAGLGAAGVGGAAVVLSPNSESRGMNALVFGLAGALSGGVIGLLAGDDPSTCSGSPKLREREERESSAREVFPLPLNPDLPPYVKNRIQPPLVEEDLEPDTVSEDGALHEPHRVYRILKPAELFAQPARELQPHSEPSRPLLPPRASAPSHSEGSP